jgi:hypothetical protein
MTNLTKNDVVIFCGGANDVAKNNSITALRHIRNCINSNSRTNIILISVPHRYDLMQSTCVNNEIRSFNRKLMKTVRAFKHTSFLEMTSDRNHFTKHDLHLNGLGKEVLSKQTMIYYCQNYCTMQLMVGLNYYLNLIFRIDIKEFKSLTLILIQTQFQNGLK